MHYRTLIAATLTACLISFPAGADGLRTAAQYLDQGQPNQAQPLIDRYLAAHPEDVKVQFLKGVMLKEQGKSGEAIKMFSAIIERHPEYPEPYNNLAVLYAEQGQYDKARMALESAIKTHPSYATAHANLSDIYAKMASDAYDKALQLDKKDAKQTKLAIKLTMVNTLFSAQAMPLESPLPAKGKPNPVPQPTTIAAAPAVVVPPPAPATPAKPVSPKSQEKRLDAPIPSQQQDIIAAVQHWAKAWSDQDVTAYLASYAADFKTPSGESRSAWEKMRRARVSSPKSIKVAVSEIQVKMEDDTHASVHFNQSYRSGRGTIRTGKTLHMEKAGDKWLIEQELTAR